MLEDINFAFTEGQMKQFIASVQAVSVGRRRFSANFQLLFRLIKGLIFLTVLSVFITLIALPGMTLTDILVCILAFMPTGWGLLLVSNSVHSLYLLSFSL